jgi:hypothetical protein
MRTGLFVAATVTSAVLVSAAYDSATSCPTIDAETVSAVRVAELHDAGWRGSPSDGSEDLYSPTCLPDDAQIVVTL